ncbi:MAG: glucosaminidase domain-containing protein [Saprospiraceae bacterium]|nr:glucosaminidase domain-containing protein [Saprospiraceae bacterium]
MQVLLVFQILLLTVFSPSESNRLAIELNYIDLYKDIAIAEMHRSGIPASIKLAQGLLESQAGQSLLAQHANNHFGIKCKSTWSGPSFYKKDDDFDHKGQLMESCFRAYDHVKQSYIDHTNFLVHRERYKDLFSYGKEDYVNWAIGLQRCGYATDQRYSAKVIELIKKHDLHQFDKAAMPTKETSTKILLPTYRIPDDYKPGDGKG